ncbi:hypothetical protein COB11_02645 [Candidatus Aerophobetes bacterium]|uniref:Lipopolysaccharide heptosyltransferase family protein n=1 Tax=Aerophobetes bacterium TaxID=2030807 RepID=A0A2A4YKC6_UNCAE|nr:MAG: hypothetical protein COB11_02645 [Candidatus Aerophobetes bacterium]
MFKSLVKKILPNPLDTLLKTCILKKKRKFLIPWNRGLGDVPLGLYALIERIRKFIPNAEITFVTRKDLHEVFDMLEDVEVLSSAFIKRGEEFDLTQVVESLGYLVGDFDYVMEKVDSDKWLFWQIGKLTPKLNWNTEKDFLAKSFFIPETNCIGVHVSTQTGGFYDYDKNWPKSSFKELFSKIENQKIILFGFEDDEVYSGPNIYDLRGKTSLLEMVSLIKNHCSHLLAPDSGVLNIAYYLNEDFPLKMVSLWSDPRQGILKQKVASPNPSLVHVPLIGKEGKVSNLSVEKVYKALYS